MKEEAFQDLMSSVRQAGRIRRGTLKAGRTTVFKPEDVKTIRASLSASQSEFALMIGVSVATLQNWEQGRRMPDRLSHCFVLPPEIRRPLPKPCTGKSAVSRRGQTAGLFTRNGV
jgi:putative transcriptional regulator